MRESESHIEWNENQKIIFSQAVDEVPNILDFVAGATEYSRLSPFPSQVEFLPDYTDPYSQSRVHL